jgi:non-canonical purine NTP pyrophosphatase (RdgB/HAM1 family)
MGRQKMNVTFITGNQGKADFLAKYLDLDIPHQEVDLDELQSLDLHEIVEHKIKQAYSIVKKPVLVEDVSLVIEAMGQLPGPFIKWFLESMGLEGICKLARNYENDNAVGRVCFAYYDGQVLEFFDGKAEGIVPEKPRGNNGFGWDSIFIPKGAGKTYAEMDDVEIEKYGIRTSTVYPQIRRFLQAIDKS